MNARTTHFISSLLVMWPALFSAAQNSLSLTVFTEPGAEIFWQGELTGMSDEEGRARIENLVAGQYSLLVIKEGFLAASREVWVRTDSQQIRVDLTPLATDSSLPPPGQAGKPGVSEQVGSPPRKPPEEPLTPPPAVPLTSESLSDFQIIFWWLLALVAGIGSWRLFRRSGEAAHADHLSAENQDDVADFGRSLSPEKKSKS